MRRNTQCHNSSVSSLFRSKRRRNLLSELLELSVQQRREALMLYNPEGGILRCIGEREHQVRIGFQDNLHLRSFLGLKVNGQLEFPIKGEIKRLKAKHFSFNVDTGDVGVLLDNLDNLFAGLKSETSHLLTRGKIPPSWEQKRCVKKQSIKRDLLQSPWNLRHILEATISSAQKRAPPALKQEPLSQEAREYITLPGQ